MNISPEKLSSFNVQLSFLRPQYTLVFLGDRTESFVDELLDALAAIGFPCVDISFRIGGDAMHAVEFAGLAPTFTECSQDLKGLAIENMHAIILAVGEVEVLLLRISREGDVPSRAGAKRPLVDKRFFHECSFRLEHLDAIVGAVTHIEQAIN